MMKYVLVPTLQHVALVKIIAELWNREDIRALISNFHFLGTADMRWESWLRIEHEVRAKVQHFSLPRSLKIEIVAFIGPIGLQIMNWLEYHARNNDLASHLPNKLCWSPRGTVDSKKTAAEVLVKDENLDVVRRYKVACIYSLEKEIAVLWEQIPRKHRDSLYRNLKNEQDLVVFWTCQLKGEGAKLDYLIRRRVGKSYSRIKFAFRCAVFAGNRAATEWFFHKLTQEEKDKVLVKFAGGLAKIRCNNHARKLTDFPKVFYTEVLCFLLSQMSEKQLEKVFETYSYNVLECFLDWPQQQHFFMETANRMWTFLSGEDYYYLLSAIVDKLKDGYKDYDYQHLFNEFWLQSPINLKKSVINQCAGGFLICDLFIVESRESIELLLSYADQFEKEELICCNEGQDICANLIFSDKWNSLKFFFGACCLSKETVIKFREEFNRRKMWYYSKKRCVDDKWSKFDQILDDLIQENGKKRRRDDGNNIVTKRLRSIKF